MINFTHYNDDIYENTKMIYKNVMNIYNINKKIYDCSNNTKIYYYNNKKKKMYNITDTEMICERFSLGAVQFPAHNCRRKHKFTPMFYE